MNKEQLIIPLLSVRSQIGDTTLCKFAFTDGTVVLEERQGQNERPRHVVSDAEGQVIDEPGTGRYPYTARIVMLALEVFDETGKLPF